MALSHHELSVKNAVIPFSLSLPTLTVGLSSHFLNRASRHEHPSRNRTDLS